MRKLKNKRTLVIISVMIILAVALLIIFCLKLANNSKQAPFFKNTKMQLIETKEMKLSEGYRLASGEDAIRKTYVYKTEKGENYTLDEQKRFYAYSDFNLIDLEIENSNSGMQRTDIGQEEIVKKIYEFLKGKIINFSGYEVDEIEKEENGLYDYQINLKNDNQDEIRCSMYSNGNIHSVLCYYHDTKELTKKQKEYFDNEFKKYLEKYQEEVQNYNHYEVLSLTYAKIEGKIYAFYNVRFEDTGGFHFAEGIVVGEK